MNGERQFINEIQRPKESNLARMIYADWLEERGDIRAEYLRLELALHCLPPDHMHWFRLGDEISQLSQRIDQDWLRQTQRKRSFKDKDLPCACYGAAALKSRAVLHLHQEVQDTQCDGWKHLLDLVEDAAAKGLTEFAPLRGMPEDQRAQIVTLPSSVARLKSVTQIHLYGSNLVRIPPEVGEMTNLEVFQVYTSYKLHWYPYEISRCQQLRESEMSTRALYGNYKSRASFPRLSSWRERAGEARDTIDAILRQRSLENVRNCSVCNQTFNDKEEHRMWISLGLGTDVMPLLVNACPQECIDALPKPPKQYVRFPHQGGLGVKQPKRLF